MLVEIILASALAFGLAYFLLELTIKLKNKNDDLMVKTFVSSDQTIIANTIMRDLYKNSNIDCNNIKFDGNKFTYKDTVVILSEYTKVGKAVCSTPESGVIKINIPISGKLSNEKFDLELFYRK